MSAKYTLTVKNNSTRRGDFAIFQESPNVNVPNVVTLAWFAKSAHPTATLEFQWDTDYSFVMADSAASGTGETIRARQVSPCNLSTSNKIALQKGGGDYSLKDQSQGETAGSLYIEESEDVGANDVLVGIGMSGNPSFLVPSQAGMEVVFTPQPAYWITFGSYTQGELIDVAQAKENAIKLKFDDVTDMLVTFGEDGAWNISE